MFCLIYTLFQKKNAHLAKFQYRGKWIDYLTKNPPDQLLSLNESFKNSKNNNKVNLSIGDYKYENGKSFLLSSVIAAKKLISECEDNFEYNIGGNKEYCSTVQGYIFGENNSQNPRICTVQSISGPGGLYVAFRFIKEYLKIENIILSSPTWVNHTQMCNDQGFNVKNYRYLNSHTLKLDIPGMIDDIKQTNYPSAVLLQPCGHNPTGIDPTKTQWDQIIATLVKKPNILPLIDMAYFGFASGSLETDKYVITQLLKTDKIFIVCNSFSGNFYGESIGSLSVVSKSGPQSDIIKSKLNFIISVTYSSPPSNGAKIISKILKDATLVAQWESDIKQMVSRVKEMRLGLRSELEQIGCNPPAGLHSWQHITDQTGMFSYTGLTTKQVDRLVKEYDIYMMNTGTICVSALTNHNIKYVAECFKKIIQSK